GQAVGQLPDGQVHVHVFPQPAKRNLHKSLKLPGRLKELFFGHFDPGSYLIQYIIGSAFCYLPVA
ncbi:MAG: hypothetical protein J4N89_12340, partial [Chloroflexi bacterium]|nr:hypothetical protein [Chloroflexota bacterium]MCI0867323.1 hypothetical protein [Chloroflexota bacterium]